MGEYVTPAGVVVRTSAVVASAVGFKPVEKPKPAKTPKAPKPAEKSDD